MTPAQIKAVFDKVYNGATNFMTPEIVSYNKKSNLLLEVSKGKGMYGETIYGATFIKITDSGYEKCKFSSGYIKKIQDAFNLLDKYAEDKDENN